MIASAMEKIRLTDRQRLERLLSRQESRIQRQFADFLENVRSDSVMRQVSDLLELGDIESALEIVDSHTLKLAAIIPIILQDIGIQEAAFLAERIGRPSVGIHFDPTHQAAADMMSRNRLRLVREFTRSQREATRAAIVESFRTGRGTVDTARAFRDSIGLTLKQRLSVDNYRRLLESGSKEALNRAIRDRRFDRSVERALREGEPLDPARIDRMVERYRARFIQLRAETIARTEALRSTSQAREEALNQVLEQTGIDRSRVVRRWNATRDARTRDTHNAMHGQERGADEAFLSPSGARLMFPGDPEAPGSETINCRCTVSISID